MTNYNAKKINEKLDVKLFDENDHTRLRLLKFTKKEIKALQIDDLVDPETKQGTDRLAMFIKEILFK